MCVAKMFSPNHLRPLGALCVTNFQAYSGSKLSEVKSREAAADCGFKVQGVMVPVVRRP